MQFSRVGMGLGLAGLVLVAMSACSEDNPGDPTHSDGGKGGSGGTGGTHVAGDGGKGGFVTNGGKGGNGGSGGGTQPHACGPYPIAELCKSADCPSSVNGIAAQGFCIYSQMATQYDTKCGGHVVEADFGTHTIVWGFDASGKLGYELFSDDVPHACGDGTESSDSEYGQAPCDRVGAIEPFDCMGMGGAGGQGGADTAGEAGNGGQGGAKQ